MMIRARVVGLTLMGALVSGGFQPTDVGAQVADQGVAQPVDARVTPGLGSDASVVEALRSPSTLHLLAPRLDDLSSPLADVDAVAMPQSGGGGRGMAYMIAGGAALVGGLIIGKSIGTVIAVGGVALGVYGIILYF